MAARPKTLPAAVVPVWLGCVLAWRLEGVFDGWLAFCTLMGAVWIQVATNFFNDAIDSDKGADGEHRLGPVRVTASGLLSRRMVYGLGVACVLVAAIFGWFLFDARGWVMLAIGVPSFYLCYGYTGGPFPLAYRGMGEVFVILFFGLVAVLGTMFVQLGEWRWEGVLLGLQLGLLSSVLISINNLRDRVEDAGNGKRTLAVKLGERGGKLVVVGELVVSFLLCFCWYVFGLELVGLIACGFWVLGGVILKLIWLGEPGVKFNRYLALGGAQLILYGVLFTVGCFL